MASLGLAACDEAADAPAQDSHAEAADKGGHEEHREGAAEEGGDSHEGHREEGHQEAGHQEEGHQKEAGPREVKLDAEAIERVGIQVASVDTGSLRDDVQATAAVEHDVNRIAHIAPMVEGQISEVRATLGDTVEAGQTLAVMRSVELGQARSAVQEARAALEVARQNFERQQKLVDKGIAAERSFIEAEGELKTAKARYQAARSGLSALGVVGGSGPTYPLKSHIDGTIIEQHASIGETKGPQDELFVVADQSEVWIVGQVAEKDAHLVRPGMTALVTLDAYPDRTWEGTVDWIASTVDQKTRLLPVRVELDNPKNQLKPGMFATIHLSAKDATRTVPLVPVDAVQQLGNRNVVFVPGDHDGEFRAQPVELGTESGGLVEVIEGLSAKSKIVSDGAFDVKAAMTAGGRSAAHHH